MSSPTDAVTPPDSTERDPATPPGRIPRYATVRPDRLAVGLVLAVYFVYQFNAILHHGSWGQDFVAHLMFSARAYQDPYKFWTTYIEGQNNPPLFHLFCAGVFKATRHVHSLEMISLITTVLNMGALLLLHRLSLRCIASPLVRVAAVVFLAFLPAGMIHAIVLAADGVATPTTVALMYTLVRLAEAGRRRWGEFLVWGVFALLTLCLAVSIKFTAVSLVPAAAAVIVAMWLARAADLPRTVVALLLVVLPAATLGFTTYRHYKTYQKSNLGVNMAIDPFSPETEINVRSLLLPRKADLKLLRDAPQYDAPSEFVIDGHRRHEMAVPNRYSYLGLLHLGVFTDIMNIYQPDPRDAYIGPRAPGPHRRMTIAARTAVPFTLCAVIAVPWMLFRTTYRVLRRRDGAAAALPVFAVLTVSFAFFLIIFLFIPFTGALAGGYWLPRLIIPALFGFFLVTFAFLDRTPLGTTRAGGVACLAASLTQAVLSLSFLWPWAVNGPEHPQLPDLVASNMAVHAEVHVRFTPQPPGTGEPLLTIGHFGVAQFVFARHDDAGNVRILYNHWGSPSVPQSEPLPADPNRTYHIVMDTDPTARTLVVTVDGREALRVEGWTPIAAFRDEVRLLENPVGGGLSTEKFSGTEVAKSLRVRGGKPWGRGTGK